MDKAQPSKDHRDILQRLKGRLLGPASVDVSDGIARVLKDAIAEIERLRAYEPISQQRHYDNLYNASSRKG